MFLKLYRIRKLRRKVKVQRECVNLLHEGVKEFRNSYYYDRWIGAKCKLVEMEDKLDKLLSL